MSEPAAACTSGCSEYLTGSHHSKKEPLLCCLTPPMLDMRKRQRRKSGSDIEGKKGCDDYYQRTFHYFLQGI
jgi:hypothetical protein